MKLRKDYKNKNKQLIPLRKALAWICLSVIAISGSSYAGFLYYRDLREKQRQDPNFNIVAIVQTTSEPMRLNTACLAELLDLSIDRPENFFHFNTQEAEKNLNHIPAIKQAYVKKIKPGIVYVDYSLRKPVALLADYTNTALDADGITFPIKPFFTPKKLPQVYLGNIENEQGEVIWGKALNGRRVDLALLLLELLGKNFTHPLLSVRSVDVSKAFASSCGEREIVVVLEELIEEKGNSISHLYSQPRMLRLDTNNFQTQLENYKILQKHLWMTANIETYHQAQSEKKQVKATIIDLRLSDLAFIVEES